MEAHFKQTVEHNWYALKYVPVKLRTLELCEIAMKQNKKAIEFVPEEFKGDFTEKDSEEVVKEEKKEVKIKSKKK